MFSARSPHRPTQAAKASAKAQAQGNGQGRQSAQDRKLAALEKSMETQERLVSALLAGFQAQDQRQQAARDKFVAKTQEATSNLDNARGGRGWVGVLA